MSGRWAGSFLPHLKHSHNLVHGMMHQMVRVRTPLGAVPRRLTVIICARPVEFTRLVSAPRVSRNVLVVVERPGAPRAPPVPTATAEQPSFIYTSTFPLPVTGSARPKHSTGDRLGAGIRAPANMRAPTTSQHRGRARTRARISGVAQSRGGNHS